MLEKQIRFIIRETLGFQKEIDEISSHIPQEIIYNLNKRYFLEENNEDNFSVILDITDEHKEITKINKINIDVDLKKADFFKIGGSFQTNKTIIHKENGIEYFEVFITIFLNLNQEKLEKLNLLKLKIESVISHELNHAFVYLQKYNKKSKSKIYNSSISLTKINFLDNKVIKEFINMLYLNLPEEIQARVQETQAVVKNLDAKNYGDLYEKIKEFQPINDAEKMIKYNGEELMKINDETINYFINLFNKDINISNNSNLNFKLITNKNKFIDYWIKNINKGGEKLKIKINKILSNKFNKPL